MSQYEHTCMIRGDGGRTIRDGLVSRTAYAEVPPRVEYALTPTGKSLIPPALALAGWAIEHVPHIEESRALHQTPPE
ncbi:helix-turn-helix domain-containing protein [Micromonospora sp. RL09-050-HVF-A]|uniref:winged helix-turn-helix transcriptional regulator n=1 Tax=unclassified Micromonospora TaxID=2617518 RepID=UPI001C5D66E0|nr:helix-turn-helix domain-containing protein [Micromonospora sp. RL09-050-HVF-A]MBW4705694.1 helix-turn-helix transcriptional regulator [Micromonospora sp. RL09-050-HVF-A]